MAAVTHIWYTRPASKDRMFLQNAFPGAPPAHPGRLHAAMGEWQTLFLRLSELEPAALVIETRRAIENTPNDGCLADRLIARSVIGKFLVGITRRMNVDHDLRVAQTLIGLMISSHSPNWKSEALLILDRCSDALAQAGRRSSAAVPLLVRRALIALDELYTNPLLNEPSLAMALNTTASHLSRELKRHTARGFLTHLHDRRAAAGYRRIMDSMDSIEAISASVGYASTKQFRRQFVRRYGISPRGVRRGRPTFSASLTSQ